jgi:hypothetical protein
MNYVRSEVSFTEIIKNVRIFAVGLHSALPTWNFKLSNCSLRAASFKRNRPLGDDMLLLTRPLTIGRLRSDLRCSDIVQTDLQYSHSVQMWLLL